MDWEWLIQLALPFLAEFILEVALPALLSIISAAVLTLAAMAINWWKNLKIEGWVKEMVEDGVLYAQEEFWDRFGEEKFLYAKRYILDRLAEKGVKINEDKLDGLIKGTVKDLKRDFAELWYNNPPRK